MHFIVAGFRVIESDSPKADLSGDQDEEDEEDFEDEDEDEDEEED